MQWARRVCQAACLGLFVYLVMLARHRADDAASLLRVFFDLNPLIVLATWLATYTLVAGALLALVTVVATLLLGRVFCGWICPLGAAHHVMTWLTWPRDRLRECETRSPWQQLKYILLVALLLMAAFGAHWIGFFDPIALMYRSIAVFVVPATQYAIEDSTTTIYRSDPSLGPFHLTSVTEPVYEFFRDRVFMAQRQRFMGGAFVAATFLVILGLNAIRPRFWCRYICPLGGLLGFMAQRPALRLERDPDTCRECGLCARNCPAAAQPHKPGEWLKTECFACWNCVASCNNSGIRFALASPLKAPEAEGIDFSRRAAVGAVAGGMAAMLTFRLTPLAQGAVFEPSLIRPPGALPEREFLQRCIQCGMCMRACPTNALQPCALEAGVEGLWTPRIVPKAGYCEYTCNSCGQVCPTGAITPLSVEEKQAVNIGLAAFDRNRCLPHAYGRDCIICEEHCPLPVKAIFFRDTEVVLPGGRTTVVKQPFVNADLCIGCGICEWSCVFSDQAAIRVTSANESRNPGNQAILPGFEDFSGTGQQDSGGPEASDPYGS